MVDFNQVNAHVACYIDDSDATCVFLKIKNKKATSLLSQIK